jgi:3-hydroxybutyryl-CoA dehydratase
MSRESYSAMVVGESTEATVEVVEAHFVATAELFHDHHPIHFDDAYARDRGHPGKTLPGAMISGITSSCLSLMLSESGLAMLEYTLRYRAPVYLGDRLTARCEIVRKEDKPARHGGLVFLAITTRNQHGALVAEGEAIDLVGDP